MPDETVTGLQNKKTLPGKEARTLLVELMHEGYDCFCSEADENGNLTVIWPASLEIGKQLSGKETESQ